MIVSAVGVLCCKIGQINKFCGMLCIVLNLICTSFNKCFYCLNMRVGCFYEKKPLVSNVYDKILGEKHVKT